MTHIFKNSTLFCIGLLSIFFSFFITAQNADAQTQTCTNQCVGGYEQVFHLEWWNGYFEPPMLGDINWSCNHDYDPNQMVFIICSGGGYYEDVWNPCVSTEQICSVSGCMDPSAQNFNRMATVDDGSCTYIPSCTTETYTEQCIDIRGTFEIPMENTEGSITFNQTKCVSGGVESWSAPVYVSGGCYPPPPKECTNGATNYPACTICPASHTLINGVCVVVDTCINGATNYPTCDQFPDCPNGATNPPICNQFTPCANGATNPPLCNQPTVCSNGAINPPTCNQFNTCSNGATNYPACDQFGTCSNGATNYPTCSQFPSCTNSATNYPVCDQFTACPNGAINPPTCTQLPICANGAINYPTCTQFNTCANGATNYPTCNQFNTCSNGATNPPACTVFPPCSNGATNPPSCNNGGGGGGGWSASQADCGSTANTCSYGSVLDIVDSTTETLWNCISTDGTQVDSCSISKTGGGGGGTSGGGSPSLTSSKYVVNPGTNVKLTANTGGQNDCVLTGGSYPVQSDIDAPGGSYDRTINAQTTFTLSCSSGGADSVTIYVVGSNFET